jgi:hypothetical protein
MPKNKKDDVAPKVTNLPLPISDTPLVIDLPDGQKIVIGKMQSGSVIEVATWRGTGRPDSRTNRLMMGMNSGGSVSVENQAPATDKPAPVANADIKSRILSQIKSIGKFIKFALSSVITKVKDFAKKIFSKRSSKISKNNRRSSDEPSNTEIDQWLENVLQKTAKKREEQAEALKAEKRVPPKAKSTSKRRK